MTEAGKPYHLLIPKILSPGEIGYFLLSSLIPHSFRTGVCPEVQNGSNAYLHDIIDILKRLYKDTRDTDLKNKVESVLQNTSYYIPKKNRKDQNFFLQVSLTDKNLNYLASDLSLSKLFISENDYQCNFFETAIRIRRPDQV